MKESLNEFVAMMGSLLIGAAASTAMLLPPLVQAGRELHKVEKERDAAWECYRLLADEREVLNP